MNKEQEKEGELRQLSERSGGGVLHVPYPSTDSDNRYCFSVLESGVTGFGDCIITPRLPSPALTNSITHSLQKPAYSSPFLFSLVFSY